MLERAHRRLAADYGTYGGPLPRHSVTLLPRADGAASGSREVTVTTALQHDCLFLHRLARNCRIRLRPDRDWYGKGWGPPSTRWFVPREETRSKGGAGTWRPWGKGNHGDPTWSDALDCWG